MERSMAETRKEARNDALHEARIKMERPMAQGRIGHGAPTGRWDGTAFVCRHGAVRGRRPVEARVALRRCGGLVGKMRH